MSYQYKSLIDEGEKAEYKHDYKTAILKFEMALDTSVRVSGHQISKRMLKDRIIDLKKLIEDEKGNKG